MSLVVKLEDDLGERGDWVMLHGVVPASAEADLLLLSGIDPFGKTVFNHLQMEAFLKEWERAKARVHDDSQLEAWEKVRAFAVTGVLRLRHPIRYADGTPPFRMTLG